MNDKINMNDKIRRKIKYESMLFRWTGKKNIIGDYLDNSKK